MTTSGQISTAGAIDADGHILEPPELWEKYLEPEYRDRAIRIRVGADGLEYLEIAGKPSKIQLPGTMALLGAMGKESLSISPEDTYLRNIPHGAMFPKERLERLDQEGLAKAILYPTIGILWEAETKDPELACAYARAYNRWIADFCSDSDGRLIPVAHIPLIDPALAAAEAARAIKSGVKGLFIHPFTWTMKSPGHPDYDRFWAIAEEAGMPVGIHPTTEPTSLDPRSRFQELAPQEPVVFTWYLDVLVAQAIQQAFASLFHHGLFDRFPRLKIVILESQAGWIGNLLDRMDAVAKGLLMPAVGLKELPSTYFRRQCWISIDPDERAVAGIIPYVGDDRFIWASDFPHADHTADYLHELSNLLALLPPASQRKILTDNVTQAYGLT